MVAVGGENVIVPDSGSISPAIARSSVDFPDPFRPTTARRVPGPIVTAHVPGDAGYALDWLLEEVSTSINTTAAGGNASLMALA